MIIGGVLVGSDMIKSAELRKLVTEMESLNSAVNAFQSKYQALPGDMKNATRLWGEDASCPDTLSGALLRGSGLPTCAGAEHPSGPANVVIR